MKVPNGFLVLPGDRGAHGPGVQPLVLQSAVSRSEENDGSVWTFVFKNYFSGRSFFLVEKKPGVKFFF